MEDALSIGELWPLADLLARPGGHAVCQGDASEIDSPPYVLLWRITDRPIYDLAAKTDIRAALVQIDCYAATKTLAVVQTDYRIIYRG